MIYIKKPKILVIFALVIFTICDKNFINIFSKNTI